MNQLKADYFKYIPEDYAGLLYLHHKISSDLFLQLKNNKVLLRDMKSGEQSLLDLKEAVKKMKK